LPDGREVALKLQYPDMASALEADLNQLKVVFAVGQRFDPAIRTDEIHAEITARLREELDYRREARHVALYRHMLSDEPGVHVPDVVASHSTDRLLAMDWLDGEKLLDWKVRPQADKDRLAVNMFRAWYVPFYSYGVIHGDPHLGNYTVRPDASVNLMDFGCVRIFPPRFRQGINRAISRPDDRRSRARCRGLRGLGLLRSQPRHDRRAEPVGRLPLRPVDGRPPAPPDRGHGEGFGRDMAQNVFGELRRMGGVRPPREFVFMDRAAIGLGAVFIHLRASINWHRLFEEPDRGFRHRRAGRAPAASAGGRAGTSRDEHTGDGSSGWLGQTLVPRLPRNGHKVVGSIPNRRHYGGRGSVVDRALVRRLIREHGIDAIVHAAARHKPHIETHDNSEFVAVNVQGTLNLLEEAVAEGSTVDRFVFTSTTSLMISQKIRDGRTGGAREAMWIDETLAPLQPRNIYGVTRTRPRSCVGCSTSSTSCRS
jgi:hypothetical protein